MEPEKRIETFEEFWPFYVAQHADPLNRKIHVFGTALGITLFVAGIVYGPLWLSITGPVLGYAMAWYGHFVVEKNRPATFSYPLFSLRGDFRMLKLALSGKLEQEVKRLIS